MKYLKVTILVGVEDDELAEWSEHADVTFFLAGLHDPSMHQYLIEHDEFPEITESAAEKLKYSCFTEEGGV